MTKRHFEAFAAAIKRKFQLDRPWAEVPVAVQCSALDAVDLIVQVAMESNDRFDAARFRLACGVARVKKARYFRAGSSPKLGAKVIFFNKGETEGRSYWEKLPGITGDIPWRLDDTFKSSFREITRNYARRLIKHLP